MRTRGWLLVGAALAAGVSATGASAGKLAGPGRFCGYAPIIDLLPGETIEALEGGIHGGSFRWSGPFGAMEVYGSGWAIRPGGRALAKRTASGLTRFAAGHDRKGYVVALWNRAHAAAWFTATHPFTPAQLAAIERVYLIDEGVEPTGCALRTVFSWE